MAEIAAYLLAITNPDMRPSSRYKSGALSGTSLSLYIGQRYFYNSVVLSCQHLSSRVFYFMLRETL